MNNRDKKASRRNEVVPMDIDAAKTLPEDKAKLRKEGRCFFCKNQGHISRNCPKRPKNPKETKTPPKKENNRKVATLPPTDEDELKEVDEDLSQKLTNLTDQDRADLYNRMIEREDF